MAQTAIALGRPLMPWQRYVMDVGLEVDPDTGLLVYGLVVLTLPRQQGKTCAVVCLMAHRCLAWPRQVVTYAAQTRDHARLKLQDDHEPMLAGSILADRYMFIQTNGFERLKWINGSVWGIQSTTKKSGHGPTLDMGVADEAWALDDNRLDQAWQPAMMTRANSQMWIPSTAGPNARDSPYLWSKVEAGREAVDAGIQTDIAHFEWGAAKGEDPADPATWAGCMPALGHTVTLPKIKQAYASMELPEFERGYLNRWSDEATNPSVIDLDKWAACVDSRSRHGSPIALAIDASVDHKHATIAMVGPRTDGRMHCEIIAHREGTAWIVAELVRLIARWRPCGVGLDLGGPIGHLHLALVKAGAPGRLALWSEGMGQAEAARSLLTSPTVRQTAQAAGEMYDAIDDGTVRWLGPEQQSVLQKAVAGARTRPLGDAWAWARRGNADISPLSALTLARWVWQVRSAAHAADDYDVTQSIY